MNDKLDLILEQVDLMETKMKNLTIENENLREEIRNKNEKITTLVFEGEEFKSDKRSFIVWAFLFGVLLNILVNWWLL